MSDAQARAAVLALNVREAGEQFADAVEELRPLAEELAAAEAEYRAAAHQAGVHDDRPPARELAAEILLGRLTALQPCIPFATRAAADRAAECLTSLPHFRQPERAAVHAPSDAREARDHA